MGLCCDSMGMALGPIPIITACRDECGRPRYHPLPDAVLRRILGRADDWLPDDAIERCITGIGCVTEALNVGEEWRARVIAMRLGLSPHTQAALARIAKDKALVKQGFNPDQPRAPAGSEGAGEWTFAVPAYRAQVFARQRDAWQRFHKAARSLPGQSGTQSFAYGETFAGEGGMAASSNGVVAGVTQSTLNDAKNATDRDGNPLFPDLAQVRTPRALTAEQAAAIYRFQTDRNFDTVGGSGALDKVGDPYAAAALNDTMFWQGQGAGSRTIQQAINDVAGKGTVPEDSQMGPATLEAYARLAQNPDTRAELLDALAQRRTEWASDEGQPDPARIEHFRYLGARD